MPDDPRCPTLSWFEIPLRDLARADALHGEARAPRCDRAATSPCMRPDELRASACMIGGRGRRAAAHAPA